MNALQQLIADYLADHPGESYASIGRRGQLPRQTVWALANREHARQTPHPDTIQGLAKGLELPVDAVRAAAGASAGYRGSASNELEDERSRLIVEAVRHLDKERLDALARRARFLLAEMREEEGEPGE